MNSFKSAINKSQKILGDAVKYKTPYKGSNTIKRILYILKKINLKNIKLKKFNNLIYEK